MGLHSRFRDGSRLLALFSALAIFQAKQSHREAKTERSEVNSPSRSLEAGQRMRPEGLRCDGAAEETRPRSEDGAKRSQLAFAESRGRPAHAARRVAMRWSGRRDSNSRHSAWEADALPTELRPRANRGNSLRWPRPIAKASKKEG